jgi:pimeloyl-ACP methyl ester carboxylesterase
MWVHQMGAFADDNRAIAIDFPGHGKSAALIPCSEQQLAELTIQLLDHLGVTRAVLVGLSMGGGVALATAITHPNRVSGLLAADAGSGSDNPPAARFQALEMARFTRNAGIAGFAERMAASPVAGSYARRGARERRHLLALLRDNDAAGVAAVIEGVQAARPPMQDRALDKITAPTTILVGAEDHGCLAPSRHAAGAIVGAELVVLPGVGHMSALEAPAAFNEALAALLRRITT